MYALCGPRPAAMDPSLLSRYRLRPHLAARLVYAVPTNRKVASDHMLQAVVFYGDPRKVIFMVCC